MVINLHTSALMSYDASQRMTRKSKVIRNRPVLVLELRSRQHRSFKVRQERLDPEIGI